MKVDVFCGSDRAPDCTVEVAKDFCFYILDCSHNLLGLDFLTATRSVLVLDQQEPELRLQQTPKPVKDFYEMNAEMSIDGGAMECTLDTGFAGFMSVPEEIAMVLGLDLQRLETPLVYSTQTGTDVVEHFAKGVAVEGFGKEMEGDSDISDYAYKILIGMKFLRGAEIEFQENGSWELTFRPRNN